ncbi:unnamed protein product [marine sediment metagenome]|uniref:Uncharacterized protein n=1 Tax=marine sediment metagenome TaxID=412755 RepID=X1C0V0_9ZZZZ
MLMKSYKQQLAEAKKAQTKRTLVPKYHDFKTDDALIVGAFVSYATVDGQSGEKSYNQYIFDTDEGLIKFHLGSAADNEIAAQLIEGVVYAIEYEGKEEISRGRSVNKFDICEVMAPESPGAKPRKAHTDGPKVNPE